MPQKKVVNLTNKIIACIAAIGLFVTGVMILQKQVRATEEADEVIYIQCDENEEYNISKYWKVDSKTAPVKAGYVFGGWYAKGTETSERVEQSADGGYYIPLIETDINTDKDNESDYTGTTYAKFVPAQVLSVKAQNKAGTGKTVTDNTHVRIISSLDSRNYDRVGFDIWLANSVQLVKDNDYTKNEPLETNKIYDGLLVGEDKQEKNAVDIFGGVSKYVSVWQLNNIDKAHWSKIIYVRPYWITMDGTKVEGLAKYVHIEDDYMNYISVPVNLLNKDVAAQAAAGAVDVTYSNAEGKTVALSFKEVEAGRLLPEMNAYKVDNTNTIKMVGNAKTPDECNNTETLYANIRFQKPETVSTDVDVDFEMTIGQFCKWDETDIVMTKTEKWDVKYDVQETTDKEQTQEHNVQLFGFESYEDVVGTKLRLGHATGRMSINTKKDYISEGNASLMVAPQGDYNRPDDWHPYIELGCIDSTIVTKDFSQMKKISMDVYNDSDEELHIAMNLIAPTLIDRTTELSEQVFTLQPKSWTTCCYDLSNPANRLYWDMENVKFIKVSFLEHKTSKEDVPNELYLDNLVGTYFGEGESIPDCNFDFHEGIAFNQDEDLYAFRSRDYADEAKIELSRISYKDEGIEAESQMGEYGMKGVVTPDAFFPAIDIVYNEEITANSVLSFMAYVQVAEENHNDDITYELNSHEASVYSENGEYPLNEWFEVHILIPEATTRTNIFYNFCSGVSETGKYIFMYGDDDVVIYMDNFLLTQGYVITKDNCYDTGYHTDNDEWYVQYNWRHSVSKDNSLTINLFLPELKVDAAVYAELYDYNDNLVESTFVLSDWSKESERTLTFPAPCDADYIRFTLSYRGIDEYPGKAVIFGAKVTEDTVAINSNCVVGEYNADLEQ